MTTLTSISQCPCGRTVAGGGARAPKSVALYGVCCGPWLDSDNPAPDAESLMRSRYSAFVMEREAYLLASWHPSRRPSHIRFDSDVKWLGLEVLSARTIDAAHAEVEFVARQRVAGGRAVRLHERSQFVREDGRWLYLSGVHDPG